MDRKELRREWRDLAKITLTVKGLQPGRSYSYTVTALDNVTAAPGPRSEPVRARTG